MIRLVCLSLPWVRAAIPHPLRALPASGRIRAVPQLRAGQGETGPGAARRRQKTVQTTPISAIIIPVRPKTQIEDWQRREVGDTTGTRFELARAEHTCFPQMVVEKAGEGGKPPSLISVVHWGLNEPLILCTCYPIPRRKSSRQAP